MKSRAYFFIIPFFLVAFGAVCPSFLMAQSNINVKNEGEINTAFQEYSPAFYRNGLVFIGSNPAVDKDKKTDDETGKKATSFFLAMREENGSLKKVVPFAEDLTTKFYDGPLSFNADGTTVYFTRSNLKRGKPVKSKDGSVKLKIYSAEKKEETWTNIQELPLNTPEYDCAHPSISPDGKRLYFSSNRPDGFGGMDLYVCTFLNGKWSIPVNCGPKINTAKNEIFPFFHADGTLYFTSNGHAGLGNLDIFFTMKTDTGWLSPRALPEPINSPSDDFGLIVSPDKMSGYYSSNRASGKGDDDIYSFAAPLSITENLKSINETAAQIEQTEASPSPRETQTTETVAVVNTSPIKNTEGTNLPAIPVQPVPNSTKDEKKGEMPVEKTDIAQAGEVKKEEPKIGNSEIPVEKTDIAHVEEVKKEEPKEKSEMPVERTDIAQIAEPKKEDIKVEKTEIPVEIEKTASTDAPKKEVKKDKPVTVAANNKKEKNNTSTATKPNKKTDKNAKPVNNKTETEKQDVLAEAENAAKRPAPIEVLTVLPLLQAREIASLETPQQMADLSHIVPVFHKKQDKKTEKALVIVGNKPSVESLEEPKKEAQPLEKPIETLVEKPIEKPIESTIAASFNNEPTHQVADANTLKDSVKTMAEVVVPVKKEATFVEKLELKPTNPENFIAEVHENTPAKKEEVKVEKTETSPLDIKKSEANGTVRKKYLVVVGTYSDHKNALDQQKKANGKGYNDAEIIHYTQNKLYGVCVMQSDDEKTAQSLARDINKSKAMEAFVKVLK
jgi:hypothetical protein